MKFGRKPRGHDSRIPKFADLVKGRALAPIPFAINYAHGLPNNLGAMLNDQLGDCTCAACCHAIQVWSFNATGGLVSPPDSAALALYELAGGYVPGEPNTDQGCVEQTVLQDWMTTGIDSNKLAAYVEVDQGDLDAIRRTIWECGLAYIGFNVPQYMPMSAGSIWDVNPTADNTIIGGHAVILVGYDVTGLMVVISWGALYYMTPAFFAQFVDEAYALANAEWITSTGKSSAGLSLADLEALMAALKWNPPAYGTHAYRWRRQRHKHLKKKQRAAAVAVAT